MHIEVFKGKKGWHWHFRNKGRTTADSEAFVSRSNAIRAAKSCVTAVCKEIMETPVLGKPTQNGIFLTIEWWHR